MLELFLILGAGAVALMALASDNKDVFREEIDRAKKEAEQLRWERQQTELAKIEREEMVLYEKARFLEDRGLLLDIEEELQDLEMKKMKIKARDL